VGSVWSETTTYGAKKESLFDALPYVLAEMTVP
jgi:hypothetical protein